MLLNGWLSGVNQVLKNHLKTKTMKWLGKRLQKKKTYSQDGEFKLCIINEDTDLMHETLGLTDQKAEELAKICLKAYENNNKATDMIDEILSHCKHINEVTMAFFMFHRITELKKRESSLGGIFKELFGK